MALRESSDAPRGAFSPTAPSDLAAYPWLISPGEALRHWDVGPLTETPYPGEPATMPDRVNYRYVNGFVDVGDLPCRLMFNEHLKGREVAYPDAFETDHTRLGTDGSVVDFSGFWRLPTHLQRFVRCRLGVVQSGDYPFDLTTCGGVRVWVNGVAVGQFEPAIRNQPSTDRIEIPLVAGDNELLLHVEDLAERDTRYFFELVYRGDLEIGVGLPDGARDALRAVETSLAGLRPDRLHYEDGTVALLLKHPLPEDVDVAVTSRGLQWGHDPRRAPTERLRRGDTRLEGIPVDQLAPGSNLIRVELHHQDRRFVRDIGVVRRRAVRGSGRNFAERCQELLDNAAGGDLYLAHALAKLVRRSDTDGAIRLIEGYLRKISQREDCSDFAILPLIWIWRDHAWSVGDEQLWKRVRSTILGWRYWFDEPGNDAMWFWSENHTLCFHAAQYLAGHCFPDELFLTSGRKGLELKGLGRRRLEQWFAAIARDGLAEWNSVTYYPVDFIGLATLFALAPDEQIRGDAKRVLDQIFEMVALHTIGGVPSGSMGRVYDKDILAGPECELVVACHLAWGDGWLNNGGQSGALLALSGYRPPDRTSQYVDLAEGVACSAAYTQGLDHAAKLKLWKSANVQLSTVVDHKTGQGGHQQHIQDVMMAADPLARFWVNHPGEHRVWGHGRPAYWAGNGVLPRAEQNGPVGLLMFDTTSRSALPDCTHLFAPADRCDEMRERGAWLFVRCGMGFAAFWAANGLAPHGGVFTGHEWRSPGRVNAWVTVVGDGRSIGFDDFCDRLAAGSVAFDAPARTMMADLPGGPRLSLDWSGAFTVAGEASAFPNMTPRPLVTFGAPGDAHSSPEAARA